MVAAAATVGAVDCTIGRVGAAEGVVVVVVNDSGEGVAAVDGVGAEEGEEVVEGILVGVTGRVAVGAGVSAKVSDPASTGSVSSTSAIASSLPWPSCPSFPRPLVLRFRRGTTGGKAKKGVEQG